MMAEHGIIFCTEMVKPILDGRKTQTRRLIRGITPHYVLAKKPDSYGPEDYAFVDMADPIGTYPTLIQSPYHVGDLLWARETWGVFDVDADEDVAIAYKADSNDEFVTWFSNKAHLLNGKYRLEQWRSARFMFKDFARIWLEVTEVKVERLQDITEQDAIREGCKHHESAIMSMGVGYRASFFELWDSLHKKPGERSGDNPWVFVPEFKRIQKGT